MTTYSRYGRQASSKEIGNMRIGYADSKKTANSSYVVKNNYGFSIADFNKGVAIYKNMYLGIIEFEKISNYIDWLKENEINFREEDLDTGMAYVKRYIKINDTVDGIEYRGNFDENNFFNEWNAATKDVKKNGR